MYQEFIQQLETEKAELNQEIRKLAQMQRDLESMGLEANAVDLTSAIRDRQKKFNELCDDVQAYQQAARSEASAKAQATKLNNETEATIKGIEALQKLIEASFSYDAVCPYSKKYLVKAWEKGFHQDGYIPYKKAA